MSAEIIYDLAAFDLGRGDLVLAALKGSTNSYLRGALVRRWTALTDTSANAARERACEIAAYMEEGLYEYKPKPTIAAEAFLALVERRLAKAVRLGQPYTSAHQPCITGFCVRVDRDAMSRFQGESPTEAAHFLALRPQLRSPYGSLVLEAVLPPTKVGLRDARACQGNAAYVRRTVLFKGGGEV